MTRAWLALLAATVAACATMPGAPPDDDAFRTAAAARYRQMLGALEARGLLDDDRETQRRLERVSPGLLAAGARYRPEAAPWAWEIHVTSDPAAGTFCLAGGKILVSGAMVRRLDLDDAELAMLLGHEIAHALAGHRRRAAEQGLESDPARALDDVRLAVRQEDEADEIGMRLAVEAGWPAPALAGFFDKVARLEGAGAYNATHARAVDRALRARELAGALMR